MRRTRIFTQNGVVALVGFMTDTDSSVVCRFDPQEHPHLFLKRFLDLPDAKAEFTKATDSMIQNGWAVEYDGPANWG
ncbi:MAG TPA: hypothetical protein PLX39_15395 [Pyrinomonadaceae bacterium]|nr:hypothetical protein [Pyrinomonadaceae bacterium]